MNAGATATRKLVDTTRKPASFARKRGDFSEDTLGRIQGAKWLDWGTHASFAPEWDDGGVGGGFGAEGISVDWAYKRLKRRGKPPPVQEMVVEPVEDVIDEKLLLEWKESTPPTAINEVEKEEEIVEEKEMSVDETLTGLRDMIILLGQLQTLRMASGKLDIPEDEKSLGKPSPISHLMLTFPADNIVTTFQTLIVTYTITPKQLLSQLPSNAYNLLSLTHPQYMGSLPARKIPQWQPPQQQPPSHHHHQQQQQQQRPVYQQQQQQPRPMPNVPQRLLPGGAGGVGVPGTNMQGFGRGQSLTPMPRPNPYTPLGQGYSGGGGQQGLYNSAPVAGTYRGVGRPRKYDVKR